MPRAALLLLLVACGEHSVVECSDRIPCPANAVCRNGECVLRLPPDAGLDARRPSDARVDGGRDAAVDTDASVDAARRCGDGVCADDEDCVSCRADCGACACEHDPCVPGPPLDPDCSDCAGAVCALDPYCCTTDWDEVCVNQADAACPGGCP